MKMTCRIGRTVYYIERSYLNEEKMLAFLLRYWGNDQ